MLQEAEVTAKMPSLMEGFESLPDPRDNRGKRHRLSFVVAGVSLAIMVGRATLSSIHRFFRNRVELVREITDQPQGRAPSRAHLPRLLSVLEWTAVNELLENHFGVRLERSGGEWTAIDGKTLRGSDEQSERTLLAVSHTEREILAQRRLPGRKTAEVTAARELLQETGLEAANVTLDALHLNPKTTAQIHHASGKYLIQMKENQPKLRAQVKAWAEATKPLGTVRTTDRGHGRLELRQGTLFSLEGLSLPERWHESGLATLLVMERETTRLATGATSAETSYYVSNQALSNEQAKAQRILFDAVRNHWRVEADNNIRDVTFREDHIRTKNGNQAQVLACLRTLAMRLFRKARITNFQAATEDFTDSPTRFHSFLAQTGFL
ncbi:MAG: ISAs1 family transposase [Planctomycetota bacterium]